MFSKIKQKFKYSPFVKKLNVVEKKNILLNLNRQSFRWRKTLNELYGWLKINHEGSENVSRLTTNKWYSEKDNEEIEMLILKN